MTILSLGQVSWSETEEEQGVGYSLVNASASAVSSVFSGKFSFDRVDGDTQCQGPAIIQGAYIANYANRPVSNFELTLTQLQSGGVGDPFAEGGGGGQPDSAINCRERGKLYFKDFLRARQLSLFTQ